MLNQVAEGMKRRGFTVFRVWGLGFDLVCRNHDIYLVKCLHNINSLKPDLASKLKRIAGFLNSFLVVIGETRGDVEIENRVVYHRYGIPVMKRETLFKALDGEGPIGVSKRGGATVGINAPCDPEDVERAAERLGVSERCVFYYMSGEVDAVKMEKVEVFKEEFGDVLQDYELEKFEANRSDKDKYGFVEKLRQMGFENAMVEMSVCDLLSRMQDLGIASKVGNTEGALRYHARNIYSVSRALEMRPLFVLRTRRKVKKSIKNVPTLSTAAIKGSDPEEFLETVGN